MRSDESSPALTGRRLGALLSAYLVAVVAVITLAPFRIDPSRAASVQWIVRDGWLADATLNVVLFVPLGFAWQRGTRRPVLHVVVLALLASAMIEALQLFIVPRFTTVSDVVANATGALVGAAVSHELDRRLHDGRSMTNRLLLDLPLVGVVYLLIPLVWLDALGATPGDSRAMLMIPLGVAGALALAAIARTVPHASNGAVGGKVVLATMAWIAIGVAPALRTNAVVAGCTLVVTIAAAALGERGWARAVRADRRLEPQVVRVIIPLMLVYLAGLASHSSAPMFGTGHDDARRGILRGLEEAGAFTVIAYLIAEWRGRRSEPESRALLVPVACVLALAGTIAVLADGGGGAAVRIAAAFGAAVFGATLYRRQLDHVIALRALTAAR